MLKVEMDLVESFFANEVFAFGTKITTVYNGVNKLIGIRTEVAAGFDTAYTLEAEGIPNTARSYIGLINKVENGICVALEQDDE